MGFHITKHHYLLLGLIICIIILDQVSKFTAIKYLKGKPPIYFPNSWKPHDIFRLTYTENTGAFLSLGSGLSESLRFWLFTVLNSIVLLFLFSILFLKKDLSPITMYSFSLIIAGGIGNILDRIFRDGKVVDFMNLGFGFHSFSIRTGIFNVADLVIVIGLVLLIIGEFTHTTTITTTKN